MGDIVERLRDIRWPRGKLEDTALEAADLIGRQAAQIKLAWDTCEKAETDKRHVQAEIKRLREALVQIAAYRDSTESCMARAALDVGQERGS